MPLTGLILFQILCTVVFVLDVTSDMEPLGMSSFAYSKLWPEIGAAAGLVLGIVFEGVALFALVRRQARLTQGLHAASGALADLMENYFRDWKLTPSEQAVAAFTIKGYSIAEVAGLRGTAEGTVKTHLNAIYRKAGVTGRAQLVSLLVEDLLHGPLVTRDGADLTAVPDRK